MPGGQPQGWTGSGRGSNGYRLAGNTLTGLAGQSGVQLRVVLASDDIFVVEGFAFDDVQIFVPGEIEVSGNGSVIADGDTTPALNDDTDFGQVGVGNTLIRTFTITNNGMDDLELDPSAPVTLSGPGAARYRVSAQPVSTVAAGTSEDLQDRVCTHRTGHGRCDGDGQHAEHDRSGIQF